MLKQMLMSEHKQERNVKENYCLVGPVK
jgi:hypothetical protein